jgi:hypothetical protein
VSEMMGSSGRRSMTDREIAEDLLAGQKYLSNYYYAPAILEAGDPGLRSAFQEAHAGATSAAKSVFDYLQSKGWYQVRKADQEDMADLRNAVTESKQVVNTKDNMGGNNVSMNQGQMGWTGTQHGEGQSGFGPSSMSQGARWGGEPSWMSGSGGQFQGAQQQGNIPQWTQGSFGPQTSFGSRQGTVGGTVGGMGWTGTQYGEGQSGFGPSSMSQGARWGGEPSWMSGSGGQFQRAQQQGNIPQWTQGSFGPQTSFGSRQGTVGGTGWTGTQYGEGQSGFGPSSLGQGARWGGEPSWSTSFGGQHQGQGMNLPNWARGGFGGAQSGPGQGQYFSAMQQGFGGPQQGLGQQGLGQQGLGQQGSHVWRSSIETGGGGWTGTQAGEGQSGFGPSSLGHYGTGTWQQGSALGRQNWQQGGQGNWQSQ